MTLKPAGYDEVMCHQIDQLKEEIKEKDVRMIEDRAWEPGFHPRKFFTAGTQSHGSVDGSDDFPLQKFGDF